MADRFFYEEPTDFDRFRENYKKSREIHAKTFGSLFEDAFAHCEEAALSLTAALSHISQRRFQEALQELTPLEELCQTEADEIALWYFKGLTYELLEEKEPMTECYEALRSLCSEPEFPLPFHPYYRTAKNAQRDSECTTSKHYYRKALAFYDGTVPKPHAASVASQILYDLATLCLYSHEYGDCERFLQLSCQYDKTSNPQRDYVKTLLLALQGKKADCLFRLLALPDFFQAPCRKTVEDILQGRELHYCRVAQNREGYERFWLSFAKEAPRLRALFLQDQKEEAEQGLSHLLTATFPFMKRSLACRWEQQGEAIRIRCKNYHVMTLKEEHSALFSLQPESLKDWRFVSVAEFDYPSLGKDTK